ncbi:MAG: hypothetical protein ABI707_00250 [Ferruginibacter sp.]
MKCELIMTSDILDILSGKEIKLMGIYATKIYKSRLVKSIGAMMASEIVFSAFTFLPGKVERSEEFFIAEQGFSKILPFPGIPK